MTERINKAIDIFLNAIEKGELAKGECRMCAVGNLVRAGGCEDNVHWSFLFVTNGLKKQTISRVFLNDDDVQKNIEATDFTWQELAKIEFAFETNSKIDIMDYAKHTTEEIRADQIKGLESVVEVMMDFDDVKGNIKELFTQKAELIAI